MESRFFKTFFKLIKPYWTSEEKWASGGLLAVVVALTLGGVYISVMLSNWSNQFYTAIQAFDRAEFGHLLLKFSWIAALYIVTAMYRVYLMQYLQIRWRTWLSAHYLNLWLERKHFYFLQLNRDAGDNPDQRIAEDIPDFIDSTLSLSLGLLNQMVTFVSFAFIIWRLSGALNFKFLNHDLHIPGYMLWIALLYAGVGTWLTHLVGKKLRGINFMQQRFEADFRFGLVRVREYSESIALSAGEKSEKLSLMGAFKNIVTNYHQLMKKQKQLNGFTSFYSQAAVVFPYLMAAPQYFAKVMTLGTLMQLGSAFGQVQDSLSYFINSYSAIARYRSVIDRLGGFMDNLSEIDLKLEGSKNLLTPSAAKQLKVTDLSLMLPTGGLIAKNLNFSLKQGSSLLIKGRSGSGKSTLLRAITGAWPFAKGSIELPTQGSWVVVPQKPYLPIGTLRETMTYPLPSSTVSETELLEVLGLCKLLHLLPQLGTHAVWSHALSPGEQQRIAFMRLFLQRPDWILLDEATSALDEETQTAMYGAIRERLPHSTLLSVAHRPNLERFHEQTFDFSAGQVSVPVPVS
jgi:vitamin B12/bleomycin/antimicrobial peptide transport system ATP-binding/permease protein